MTELDDYGYVSVIGFSFLYPLMELLDKLLDLEGIPSEVQASQRENGFASAIIVLAVLMVESSIARVKFDEDTMNPRSSLKFMQSRFPDYSGLAMLEELFVIRDAIVHNHLWQAKITWDKDMDLKLLAAEKWEGSGDMKLSAVIDTSTRKTKILGLNLFPTRIAKGDAILVLKKASEILQFIEANGSRLVNVSNQYVKFRGHLVEYLDLVTSL